VNDEENSIRKSRTIFLIVAGIVAAPLTLAVAVGCAGAGHGSGGPLLLFYPYTMIAARFCGGDPAWLLAPSLLQFPLYGAGLSFAEMKGRLRLASILLTVLHGAAVSAAVALIGL
jgi:hypothetical protein